MSSSRTFEENRSTAKEALARYSSEPLLHLIDGELVPSASGDTFDNFSPVDGRLLGEVAAGGAGEIGLASEAAAAAFEVGHDSCVLKHLVRATKYVAWINQGHAGLHDRAQGSIDEAGKAERKRRHHGDV